MIPILIPIAVGLVACFPLGINPLKVAAGLAALWFTLFLSSLL